VLTEACLICADTVVLKNGAEFQGVVETQNDREVVLRMAYGTMSFQASEVKSVLRAPNEENARLAASWAEEKRRLAEEQTKRQEAEAAQRAKGLVMVDGQWVTPEEAVKRPPPAKAETSSTTVTADHARSKLATDLFNFGKWTSQSTQHFVIFSQDSMTGKAVESKAEYYLEKIRYDLNLPREVKWSTPCEVYVVKDEGAWGTLVRSRVRLTSAVGFSSPVDREIFVRGVNDPIAVATFAHELSHVLIYEFGEHRPVPLWLQEGLAIYESGELVGQGGLLREAMMQAKLMTFAQLHDTYRGRYPVAQDDLIIFCLESSSVVDFLINRFGREKFSEFAHEVIWQSDITRAVRKVFTGQFTGANDLYNAWLQSLAK
jgi:hypothetical protein